MKVTSSYAVEIKKQRMFDDTIKLYREAVSFLIDERRRAHAPSIAVRFRRG